MSIGRKMVERLRRFVETLKRITPSNAELLKLAERHPPPPEWYEESEG